MKHSVKQISLVLLLLVIAACTPKQQDHNPRHLAPKLERDYFMAGDGMQLQYQSWRTGKPKAVILALHGFNDYSHAFELFGQYLKKHRIALYAYDQRGFGTSEPTGIWAGEENLVMDTVEFLEALHKRHPHAPIYLLGDSMGGAVAIITTATRQNLPIEGLILTAPAVWGEESFNFFFRSSLWFAAHMAPGWTLTGEGLKIQATDNIEILKEMGRDPLIIKATRLDAIYGLVNLMDGAHAKAGDCPLPVLVQYGLKDMVIPREPVDETAARLEKAEYITYPAGYHMLLRDTQRVNVFDDIRKWVLRRRASKQRDNYAPH